MNNKERRLAWLAIGACVVLALSRWSRPVPAAPTTGEKNPGKPAAARLQGVASCALAACHHGNGARQDKGSEYTTWIMHDKHARAYQVLLEERSRIIERNFRKLKSTEAARPEQDALCLYCHVMPGVQAMAKQPRFELADGVGCESCHGAAEKWLRPHTTWQGMPSDKKKQLYDQHGMTWLRDLEVRATVCIRCHVGSAEANVNHDLIAAGHPRLIFEYAAYLDNMPWHWSAAEEKARHPDFEARAWVIGQAASARAFSSHAGKGDFADYECFACHHELHQPSGRQQRGYVGIPGSLPPARWYQVLAPVADANKQMSAKDVGRLLKAIRDEQKPVAFNWDAMAQRYLALAALHQALRDFDAGYRDETLEEEIKRLAEAVRFPENRDSPGK